MKAYTNLPVSDITPGAVTVLSEGLSPLSAVLSDKAILTISIESEPQLSRYSDAEVVHLQQGQQEENGYFIWEEIGEK